MSMDSLVTRWRWTTDMTTTDGRARECDARSAVDAAAVSVTASATGSQWMKVSMVGWVSRDAGACCYGLTLTCSTAPHCGMQSTYGLQAMVNIQQRQLPSTCG